jgi:hypothetical protein
LPPGAWHFAARAIKLDDRRLRPVARPFLERHKRLLERDNRVSRFFDPGTALMGAFAATRAEDLQKIRCDPNHFPVISHPWRRILTCDGGNACTAFERRFGAFLTQQSSPPSEI